MRSQNFCGYWCMRVRHLSSGGIGWYVEVRLPYADEGKVTYGLCTLTGGIPTILELFRSFAKPLGDGCRIPKAHAAVTHEHREVCDATTCCRTA